MCIKWKQLGMPTWSYLVGIYQIKLTKTVCYFLFNFLNSVSSENNYTKLFSVKRPGYQHENWLSF